MDLFEGMEQSKEQGCVGATGMLKLTCMKWCVCRCRCGMRSGVGVVDC